MDVGGPVRTYLYFRPPACVLRKGLDWTSIVYASKVRMWEGEGAGEVQFREWRELTRL